MKENPLLQITDLTVDFPSGEGRFTAVNGVAFSIRKGEALALVGESGSGKSVTALTIMQLLGRDSGASITGSVLLDRHGITTDLATASEEEMKHIRGRRIAMIFQEPMSSLNPAIKCGEQIAEALRLHMGLRGQELKQRVRQVLTEVGVEDPERIAARFPSQISGGQKQRVMIAIALACDPELLIADEPTTALDASVRRRVLTSIREARKDRGLSILFITHDLDLITDLAERVVVMYAGKIVEEGPTDEVFHRPKHPYTKGLISCRPPREGRYYFLPTIDDFMRISADGNEMEEITDLKEVFKGLEITQTDRESRHRRMYSSLPLLKVDGLVKSFRQGSNMFKRKSTGRFHAVDHVSFDLYPGETLGLVGRSGCGKTTLARCILGLEVADGGKVSVRPTDGLEFREIKSLVKMGRRVQYIFQDSSSSLDPLMTIGETLSEPLHTYHPDWTEEQRKDRILEILTQVGLKHYHFQRYPIEFSGGQRQRIAIARALLLEPSVIICDEPVSSLDVSVQAQVLNLLNELKYEYNLSYIFISHDMNVVRFMSDRVAVMHEGKIVEYGEADDVFHAPSDEHTKRLVFA